jgi:hypothetical protein
MHRDLLMGDFRQLFYISLDSSTFLHQSRFSDCAFEVEVVLIFIFIFSNIVFFFFRLYALRRIRDGFRAGKPLTDSTKISEALQKAEENLEVIKRQVR